MAGAGWRDFVAGEVLTAANVQDYLQDQAVMTFASSTARGSAIASPSEGMTTYLADSNVLETYSGSAWERQTGGLIPVIPTTVTIATGSGSANSIGVVTFTGATSVALDGVFTSAYTNYRVVVTVSATSTTNGIRGRLASAGVELGTTVYNRSQWYFRSDGTSGASAGASGTYFAIVPVTTTATNTAVSIFDVTNPATAVRKTVLGMSQGFTGTTHETSSNGCTVMDTTSRDGLKLVVDTGNATGTVQVFAYND